MERQRIDKWLWAARFYKTRSLASEDLDLGRVAVNGQAAKPAREVKVGDTVAIRRDATVRTVVVRGLSGLRGFGGLAVDRHTSQVQVFAGQ